MAQAKTAFVSFHFFFIQNNWKMLVFQDVLWAIFYWLNGVTPNSCSGADLWYIVARITTSPSPTTATTNDDDNKIVCVQNSIGKRRQGVNCCNQSFGNVFILPVFLACANAINHRRRRPTAFTVSNGTSKLGTKQCPNKDGFVCRFDFFFLFFFLVFHLICSEKRNYARSESARCAMCVVRLQENDKRIEWIIIKTSFDTQWTMYTEKYRYDTKEMGKENALRSLGQKVRATCIVLNRLRYLYLLGRRI